MTEAKQLLAGFQARQCLLIPRCQGQPVADSWVSAQLCFQFLLSGQIPTTPWHSAEEIILKKGAVLCCAPGAASVRRTNVAREHVSVSHYRGEILMQHYKRTAQTARDAQTLQGQWRFAVPTNYVQLEKLIVSGFNEGLAKHTLEQLALCTPQLLFHALERSVPSQLTRALQWLREHACEDLTRNDLAAYLQCHPDHVTRLFREAHMQTFSEERIRMRCERASEYLFAGGSVAEVARLCGFNSETYFIRCFKQQYAVTPGQWRLRNFAAP